MIRDTIHVQVSFTTGDRWSRVVVVVVVVVGGKCDTTTTP